MRIAVMAAGAVGGYFGARLAAGGHDVTFFARGAHLEAIRKNGLKVESPLGDLHLKDVIATDDTAAIGPVDIVLFAVKLWDTEKAAESLRALLGPATRVITAQNGIDSVERLTPILGSDHVVPGLAQIATVIAAPGVIRHSSKFATLRCGYPDRHADPALAALVDAARRIALDIALTDTIEGELWHKFTFLTALSGMTAATRMPIGPLLADPDTRAFFHALLSEVAAVGRAKGAPLPPNFSDLALAFADATLPRDMKASMAHDLERGNRLELDWLAGKVVELGRTHSIPTPANAAIYAVLKPYRMGRPS